MSKQQVAQKYIFKINTTRLKKAKWNLSLPLTEARRNDEVISIGDSQMLRWIDELNGIDSTDQRVAEIRTALKAVKRKPHSVNNKREIRRLYDELDRVQFKPDYMHLVVDKDKDLFRACKGFKINGVKYVRLLGTSGGVKNSTVVFVSERLAPILRVRIENGRNQDIPLVPAKFEAYRALTCSGSIPVSMPNGILVVPDCETRFREDVLYISDENDGEPQMSMMNDYEITLTESDGYGLMLPALAERWSHELKLDYVASGMNTRFSWEKGMVFTFDFVDFADKVAGTRIVKDAWGNEVDIGSVELILTTSMLKLWKCYASIEDYLENCAKNHYTFGVTKTSPRELESSRTLNYQFIQSYEFTDEQIDDLIQPTIDEINDITSGDIRKALLFLAGKNLDQESALRMDDFVKALMIEPRMFNDPYIRKKILQMIRKRIDDAKIGVINVHGNYSIVGGDPYALCQSIFGMEVTGLMKAGEIYNKYWVDVGAEWLACYRAPMTCHNNIRKMRVTRDAEKQYWYQYIKTCTLFNAWDSSAAALNGMDKDGDLVMLTDNHVLVDNIRETPTLLCVQRAAPKAIASEQDLVRANIASFGSDVGKVTNWITTMFDVQAQYEPGSPEYKVLDYRIKCGQHYQQCCIDKTKGIISKPMPRYWHDRAANKLPDNPTDEQVAEHELNLRVVADKKPYFMRYIYPNLMRQYNTYIKNTNTKCLREFRMTVDEMLCIPEDKLTEEQSSFLRFFWMRMPVGMHDCVMNRICRKVEAAFSNPMKSSKDEEPFDYSFMKSGAEYTNAQYLAVQRLFVEHNKTLQEKSKLSKSRDSAEEDVGCYLTSMIQHFKREGEKICSNAEALCDIVIEICYRRNGTRQFVWDVVGETVISNLLKRKGYQISFPIADPEGDIVYAGERYSMIKVGVDRDE